MARALSPTVHLFACLAIVASAGAVTLQHGYGDLPAPVSPGTAPVQGADSGSETTPLPVLPRGNTGGSASGPLGMNYYGGPVLHNPIGLYIFWLGTFRRAQKSLVRSFVASLNPSRSSSETVPHWWNISTCYYDGQGRHVSSSVSIAGEYSASTVPQLKYNATKDIGILSGPGTVSRVISDTLTAGIWPTDPDAVYVLFTGTNIMQIGTAANSGERFCRDYCGWHSSFRYTPKGGNKTSIKYLWVGLPTRLCPGQCITKLLTKGTYAAPNRDPGTHAAISTLAHELTETATNPTGKSWVNAKGRENADICSWRFGKIQAVNNTRGPPTGFNLRGTNGSKFLVQLNWDITTGACSLGIPPNAPPPPSPPPPLLAPTKLKPPVPSKGFPVRPGDTTPKGPPPARTPRAPRRRPRRTRKPKKRPSKTTPPKTAPSTKPPSAKPPPKLSPPPKPAPRLSPPPPSGCWCFLPIRRTCPPSCTHATAASGPRGASYGCYKTRRRRREQFQCCIISPACSKFTRIK